MTDERVYPGIFLSTASSKDIAGNEPIFATGNFSFRYPHCPADATRGLHPPLQMRKKGWSPGELFSKQGITIQRLFQEIDSDSNLIFGIHVWFLNFQNIRHNKFLEQFSG
jgi:hypothetical protein